MLVVTKFKHENVLREKEEEYKRKIEYKEMQFNQILKRKEKELNEIKKEHEDLMDVFNTVSCELIEKEKELKEAKLIIEKLEKENKELETKKELTLIVKNQLNQLCICEVGAKGFMYSDDLIPIHISVSGRKVFNLARLLG